MTTSPAEPQTEARAESRAQPRSPRSVSIVVPVGRVDTTTFEQLAAIAALDLQDLEVELVVSLDTGDADDGSTLRTAVDQSWTHPVVIVESPVPRGAAHARNAGAEAAHGDVLAFCDADDLVDRLWLVHLVEALDRHDAVSGRLVEHVDRPRDAGLRPPATPDGLPRFLGVPYLLSGNMAIGAELFRAIGGFDTSLHRCEDTALSWRLLERGCTLGFASEAVVRYRMRSGLVAMMRQQFSYGRGASHLLVRQGLPHGFPHSPDQGHAGRRMSLVRANGQAGGRGSYVRVLRRGATAAGRAAGLVDEAAAAIEHRLDPPPQPVRRAHPAPPPRGARLLMVADAGGHLLEGTVMHRTLYGDLDTTWYTADTLMSRTLLRDERSVFARRRVLPRRPDRAALEFATALRTLRRLRPDIVVSTGSAVALPWLAAAILTRRRAVFHESAARVVAPSLTGRLIEHVPGVERYTQHPMQLPPRRARRWSWSYSTLDLDAGSVAATRSPAGADARAESTSRRRSSGNNSSNNNRSRRRLFVSVGTYEYPFVRLFRRLELVVPDDWDIVWQLGNAGGYRPRRGEVHDFLDYDQMLTEVRAADLTVTHAGVGSILTVLEAGGLPVVVARRHHHGEIADDHQLEVVAALRAAGVTALTDVDELTTCLFRSDPGSVAGTGTARTGSTVS
ncbi:MAG: hypothetical protein RI958_3025 [Actinomycetota bacterium]